ncbi:hypothetical protein SGM_5047 [Streptomyces griseoaurantiacus M045]|uniref:Uncharacterized protein n=1 Tax=Streptomyces griseoaurantiacus M045 TaxID=996637 RepID=F3NPI3_9ACTN|nr:hypothetical protein SGM_5047 [Streptomyces griseoaurantiacus M045]
MRPSTVRVPGGHEEGEGGPDRCRRRLPQSPPCHWPTASPPPTTRPPSRSRAPREDRRAPDTTPSASGASTRSSRSSASKPR